LTVLQTLLPVRFAAEGQTLFDEIKNIEDPDQLERIIDAAIKSRDFAELMTVLGR
jgi:hypothetical protein